MLRLEVYVNVQRRGQYTLLATCDIELLGEILNDGKKAGLFSRKGRERARAFDVSKMLERTEAVYERLSADREGGRK